MESINAWLTTIRSPSSGIIPSTINHWSTIAGCWLSMDPTGPAQVCNPTHQRFVAAWHRWRVGHPPIYMRQRESPALCFSHGSIPVGSPAIRYLDLLGSTYVYNYMVLWWIRISRSDERWGCCDGFVFRTSTGAHHFTESLSDIGSGKDDLQKVNNSAV